MNPLNTNSGKMIRMTVSSNCSICLSQFEADEERVLSHPPQLQNGRLVTHEFHDACLTAWLQNCRESGKPLFCPLCRSTSTEPQQNLSSGHSLAAPQRQVASYLANRVQQLPPSAPSFIPPQRQPAPFRIQELPPLIPRFVPEQRETVFGSTLEFPLLSFFSQQREAQLNNLLNSLQQQAQADLNDQINRMQPLPPSAPEQREAAPRTQYLSMPLPSSSSSERAIRDQFHLANRYPSILAASSEIGISHSSSSSSSSSNQLGMTNVQPPQIGENEESETPADKHYSLAIELLNQGNRAGAMNQFNLVARSPHNHEKHNHNVARFTTHYELGRYFRDDLQDVHKAQFHFTKCIRFHVGCRHPDRLAEARIFMAELYSTGAGRIQQNVDKSLKLLHQILSNRFGVRDDLIQTAKAKFKLYANGIDYTPEAYRQLAKSKKRTASEALGGSEGNNRKKPREG